MELKRWSSNQKLEIWKDIQNYEGLYRVSSLGRVKSLGNNKTKKEKILKLNKNKYGYFQVILFKKSKMKSFRVHRLVAQVFIPNPDNKPCIDHINTIRTDNRVCNLRWVTSKENNNNPLTREKLQGGNNPRAKKVRCIETGEVFGCVKEACEWCETSKSSIASQIQGKYKYAGTHPITNTPLHWEYVVEEVEIDLNIIPMSNIIMINI